MSNNPELNEFGKLLALANSDKYKDNQIIQSILSTINYQKAIVGMHKALKVNNYEGYFKALDGEVGYTLFGLDEHNIIQAVKIHTCLSVLKEMLTLLDSVLISLGEEAHL